MPDIVAVDEGRKETRIIDIAISESTRVDDKQMEKIEKYRLLKDKIGRIWAMRTLTVIPKFLGALEKYVREVGNDMRVDQALLCW